jgi:AraC-like DNA-binding protein
MIDGNQLARYGDEMSRPRGARTDGGRRAGATPADDPSALGASGNATRHLRPFLELAKEAGGDTDAVLRAFRLTEEQMRDPATRMTFEQTQELLQRLISLVDRSDVGLGAATRYVPDDLDIVGYMAPLCRDPWTSLETISRYSRLICDSVKYDLECSGDRATIRVSVSGGRRLLPEVSDAQLAAVHHFLRLLTGDFLPLARASLARARPRNTEPYRRYFGVAVRFDAPENLLVYPLASVKKALPTRNDRLLGLLSQQADRMLAAMPRLPTLLERVRTTIRSQLEQGAAVLSATAHELGMSERSLRRHLKNGGGSYRSLCEAVRRERALVLLRSGEHSVTEVAQLVGFTDPTAFARAVRRWTGTHPSGYVRRLRLSIDPA